MSLKVCNHLMDFSVNNQRMLQLTLSFVIVNIVIECTVFVCLCVNTNPIVNDCHAHLKAILTQIPADVTNKLALRG